MVKTNLITTKLPSLEWSENREGLSGKYESQNCCKPDSRLKKDDGDRLFDHLKMAVKRQVTYEFAAKADQDKIYRIAYIESQVDDTEFGRLIVRFSAAILYAEEIYSDRKVFDQ